MESNTRSASHLSGLEAKTFYLDCSLIAQHEYCQFFFFFWWGYSFQALLHQASICIPPDATANNGKRKYITARISYAMAHSVDKLRGNNVYVFLVSGGFGQMVKVGPVIPGT